MLLDWVVIFLILAILAAVFGFGGFAADFAGIAKILFGLFIILFVFSLLYRMMYGRPPQGM
ncbi:MAG TPA: DUF1328 domain-containing protein [Candidatus Babeliales bacterium]|nr:DUF1328 domain-containing protein [Candidatus Babeliales bacterium]